MKRRLVILGFGEWWWMEDDEGFHRSQAQGLYNMYDFEQTDYPKDVNIFMICTISPFPSYSYIKNID